MFKALRVAVAAALLVSAAGASAQLRLPRIPLRVPGVSLDSVLGREAPITTSIADARFADAARDGFTPPAQPRRLETLGRTPNGGFVLQPGYFRMQAQSYCLHAGTHGPGGGDGYLYAPTKGAAEDAVMTIVRNSVNHPEIEQRQIQTLLWAIVARTKFEEMSTEHKAVAARLLTPRQLAALNRSALDMIPGPAMNALMSRVPGPLRQVVQAEAQLRQMLTSPGASFAELERVAVLSGNAPLGEGSRQTPSGRWSLHPDGYHVRYIPSGYSSTRSKSGCRRAAPRSEGNMTPPPHRGSWQHRAAAPDPVGPLAQLTRGPQPQGPNSRRYRG
jgi:hypothetical protein